MDWYIMLKAPIRLILAMLLGSLIGEEREKHKRPAGLRTHMIVCMSSALVMLTAEFIKASSPAIDVTRLGGQVISGIGFLGAGAIIKDGFSVSGLTTAATLWAVACVGIAIGGGYYAGGILTTLLIYGTLKFKGKHPVINNEKTLVFLVTSADKTLHRITEKLKHNGVQIIRIHISDEENQKYKMLKIVIRTNKEQAEIEEAFKEMQEAGQVNIL